VRCLLSPHPFQLWNSEMCLSMGQTPLSCITDFVISLIGKNLRDLVRLSLSFLFVYLLKTLRSSATRATRPNVLGIHYLKCLSARSLTVLVSTRQTNQSSKESMSGPRCYITDAPTYLRRHLRHPHPPRLRPLRPMPLSSTHPAALASLPCAPFPRIWWPLPPSFALADCAELELIKQFPALFRRADADKDTQNKAAGLSSACSHSPALRPMCGGLLLGVRMRRTKRAPAPFTAWRSSNSKSSSRWRWRSAQRWRSGLG
jgi:hypothetical protein